MSSFIRIQQSSNGARMLPEPIRMSSKRTAQVAVKVAAPNHPPTLVLKPDDTLDPGSGPYVADHSQRIARAAGNSQRARLASVPPAARRRRPPSSVNPALRFRLARFLRMLWEPPVRNTRPIAGRLLNAIKEQKAALAFSDGNGKATFPGLPSGSYFINLHFATTTKAIAGALKWISNQGRTPSPWTRATASRRTDHPLIGRSNTHIDGNVYRTPVAKSGLSRPSIFSC